MTKIQACQAAMYLLQCDDMLRRQPNFGIVDFFNVRPATASVDRINGIVRPVGKRNVTTEVVEGRLGRRILADDECAAKPSIMTLIVALAVTVMMHMAQAHLEIVESWNQCSKLSGKKQPK